MKLIPTTEQVTILEAATAGKHLAIKARAGASKTTTCEMIAKALPKKTGLYIAFNKSIATEASGRFPSSITCQTVHSLAWRAIIKNMKSKYAKKLQNFYDYNDIPFTAVKHEDEIEGKLEVVRLIKEYCQSAELSLDIYITSLQDKVASEIVKATKEYWKAMIDESSSTKMTPDIYLKLYQLSSPVLDFGLIFLDEAQDANPVILDIVFKQRNHAQCIIVGDDFQSIYEWRGAVNALENLPKNFEHLYLTTSFRFTQEIADLATNLINIGGNDRPIIGKATFSPKVDEIKSRAVLVRTNATLLARLKESADRREKVYVLADLRDVWAKAYHISALYFGEKPKYPVKELEVFKDYDDLVTASKNLPELKKLIDVTISLSKGGIATNINKIKEIIVDKPEDAAYTLTTVHKSKGLEWDSIEITDDIIQVPEGKTITEALFEGQTLNVAYVAVTRGKYEVKMPPLLADVIANWEFHLTKAVEAGFTSFDCLSKLKLNDNEIKELA